MYKLANISTFESIMNHGVPNPIEIRKVRPEEGEKVKALMLSDFYPVLEHDYPNPPGKDAALEEFYDPNRLNIGAFDDDNLVGFTDINIGQIPGQYTCIPAKVAQTDPEKTASWFNSVVAKKYRGRGLQRKMYATAQSMLPPEVQYIDVTPNPGNTPSVRNIEQLGFERIGPFRDVLDKQGVIADPNSTEINHQDYYLKKLER